MPELGRPGRWVDPQSVLPDQISLSYRQLSTKSNTTKPDLA